MTTQKTSIKLHFKIQLARKSTKRKVFFYDENANDIAEEEEEEIEEPSQDAVSVITTANLNLEGRNSSIININDDSGCFSSDTSLKFSEKTHKSKQRRLFVTQRTKIDGSRLWDINDSNQEAFIAIYVKKISLDEESSIKEPPSECSDVGSIGHQPEELLPQELLSTVSVQVGEHFCLRTLGSIRENGKKRKRVSDVVQRKNEWKKFKNKY